MEVNRWSEYEFEYEFGYEFTDKKVAKNRIVVPPMASQTADPKGFVTPETLQHYQKLARSDAGLIFVEYSYVHFSGKSEARQLSADSDENIPGLKCLAETIHRSGALAGLQIVHAGGKSDSSLAGGILLGASAVPVPTKDRQLETPVELGLENINTYIQWYVEAAERAQSAGFDFVEIHAAHGYGLNQWLSPLTNQRTDKYGGTVTNRARLLAEMVRQIRAQVPRLLISVRIPGQDYFPGGLSLGDMAKVVKILQAEGVDLINVSSGIGGWRRPAGKTGEGYLVKDAAFIKQNTSLPVIGVGGIESGFAIDQMLGAQSIDFAAVGRALLKAPDDWYSAHLSPAVKRALTNGLSAGNKLSRLGFGAEG